MKELLLVISVILAVLCIVLLVKNNRTYVVHTRVCDAIYKYRNHCYTVDEEPAVDFSDMCTYEKTLHSIFDWGYGRVLPADKYEIIKPYIKED